MILRAIDEALKSDQPAHRPTGIEMLVGRVNASRIVFRAINQRDFNQPSRWGKKLRADNSFRGHIPSIPTVFPLFL